MQTLAGTETEELAGWLRALGIRTLDLETLGDLFAAMDLRTLTLVLEAAVGELGTNSELALERHRELNPAEDCLVLQVRQASYATDLMDRIDGFLRAHENELAVLKRFVVSTDFQHARV